MTQPDLFTEPQQRTRKPAARSADPDTSHAAARSMVAAQPSIQERILQALVRPMTQFELARATGLRPEQVHKRLSELSTSIPDVYVAEIIDTGERRAGDTGRMCIVWRRTHIDYNAGYMPGGLR